MYNRVVENSRRGHIQPPGLKKRRLNSNVWSPRREKIYFFFFALYTVNFVCEGAMEGVSVLLDIYKVLCRGLKSIPLPGTTLWLCSMLKHTNEENPRTKAIYVYYYIIPPKLFFSFLKFNFSFHPFSFKFFYYLLFLYIFFFRDVMPSIFEPPCISEKKFTPEVKSQGKKGKIFLLRKGNNWRNKK